MGYVIAYAFNVDTDPTSLGDCVEGKGTGMRHAEADALLTVGTNQDRLPVLGLAESQAVWRDINVLGEDDPEPPARCDVANAVFFEIE